MLVRGNIKTKFKVMLMAVIGLPGSGKTTLVGKLMPAEQMTRHEIPDLGMYEAGYSSTSRNDKFTPEWGEFTREQIYGYMVLRALIKEKKMLPELENWTHENSLPMNCLDHKHLRIHFEKVYKKLNDELKRFTETESDVRRQITAEPNYVLLNVFDIGANKALYESLPLIAHLMNPILLLNVLDLSRDGGERLRDLPDMKDIHQRQHILQARSRGHYYVRISAICKSPGHTIMIGTHRDKIPKRDVERKKRLTEAGIRAKAVDVGASESMQTEMLAANLHDKEDVNKIKAVIEEVVATTKKIDHNLPLTWIFLRSALMTYQYEGSDFLLPREVFDYLARQCGIVSKEEVEKCLEFFTRIGSLMNSPEFFLKKIIYRPQVFFQKLNILYDSVENGDKHCKETLRFGLLCTKVAEEIWGNDKEFFWGLLKEAGVGVPLKPDPQPDDPQHHYDYGINCRHCKGKHLLFVPGLRMKYLKHTTKDCSKCGKGPTLCKACLKIVMDQQRDSLFVTFTCEYVPQHIHTLFVKYFKTQMEKQPNLPKLSLKSDGEYYNCTTFQFANEESFQVLVHGNVLELKLEGFSSNPVLESQIKTVIKETAVMILDTALKYFPGIHYQIGFICTDCCTLSTNPAPNNNITSYLTFLPSQYETELYCRNHYKNIEKAKKLQQNGEEQEEERGTKQLQQHGEEQEEEKVKDKEEKGKMIKLSDGQIRWMTVIEKVCVLA